MWWLKKLVPVTNFLEFLFKYLHIIFYIVKCSLKTKNKSRFTLRINLGNSKPLKNFTIFDI